MALSSEQLQYKQENEALRMENKYLRDSKLALIIATADEIERLRRFITFLSNALRSKGYNAQHIESLASSTNPRNNRNRSSVKKKTEWKYKQKQKQNNNKNKSNIASNWYSNDSISNVSTAAAATLSSLVDTNTKTEKKAPMSLKERMNALQNKAEKPGTVSAKMKALKAERNLGEVKVTTTSKDNIASLFAAKIEKQKKSAAAGAITGTKGKILKEALKNPEPEKAAEIVESLGLFVAKQKTPNFKKQRKDNDVKQEEKEEEEVLEVLNMNNNVMMKKMSEKEKENMENLICDSMIKNEDLKCVQMCNANVNDAFLKKILDKLSANRERHNVKELWLESNPIGDCGMQYLTDFMMNDDKIEIIKLYNNKKTISTAKLNALLDGLQKNETVTKFVFDGFRFQHQKDKKERYLRRNAEIARKKRNAERKRLKELANS